MQPSKPISKNGTADTDTPKKVTIMFDPKKVVMINSADSNQSTKKAPIKNGAMSFSIICSSKVDTLSCLPIERPSTAKVVKNL